MSILDTIKSWAKSLWNAGKKFFLWDTYEEAAAETQQEENKQTLNQQIVNWNINSPVDVNASTPANVNTQTEYKSAIQAVADSIWAQNWEIDTVQNPIQQNTPEVVKAKELTISDLFTGDRKAEAWSKLPSEINNLSSDFQSRKDKQIWQIGGFIDRIIDSNRADAEYNRNEKLMAVGYDSGTRNVQYLDLNEDRWIFDFDFGTRSWSREMFNKYLSEYSAVANDPNISQAEKYEALWDFYTKARWLFRIAEEDRYSNWFFSGEWIKRRDEMYTQDQLDTLSSWQKQTWRYTPTYEEFVDYLDMYIDNQISKRDIDKKYWLRKDENAPEDTETLDLSSDFQSKWKSNLESIATQNFDDYFGPMRTVNWWAGTEVELYAYWIINDRLDALYNAMAPVYSAEKEILSRDKSTWTQWDVAMLDTAQKYREMEKWYARWINEWIRQQALYGTSKDGHMVRMLDTFEWWKSLWDILNWEAIQASWRKFRSWWSMLDIVEDMANEALWWYTKDHNSWFWAPLKNLWSDVEFVTKPIWTTLWELWQWIFWVTMDTLSYAVDWTDSQFADYQDQDFSVWFMLETDDWNFQRTVKKYAVDIAEYAPEAIWNLLPDIAITVATWWAWWVTFLRHVKDFNKVKKLTQAAKWASFLKKLWTISTKNPANAAKALWLSEWVVKATLWAIKSEKTIPQVIKTWAELTDRMITNLALWQLMDWQWSAYDTEPYSNASFIMSMVWSTVFDVFPELFRLSTWRNWFDVLTWDLKAGNVWDLARYIDSSPEAANNVARALWKQVWDIWFEDLKAYARNFWAIEEAAKQVYNQLSSAEKAALWKMTKDLTWNFVSQTYWSNSNIAKNVRRILANGSTNIADVYKYLGRIPWEVSIWPYVSKIQLKNWTEAYVVWTREKWLYDEKLDAAFAWNFTNKIRNWFSAEDIDTLSKIKKEYSELDTNKDKYFYKIENPDGTSTYHLNEQWLKKLWMKAENLSLEALWVSLARAEDVKWIFKEKMKNLTNKNIKDNTVDRIADTWAYDEIVYKVKEVLWC